MLYLTGDAACDVEFRTDCNAGLADLTVVVCPSGVYGCTAGADFRAESLGKLIEKIEISLLPTP